MKHIYNTLFLLFCYLQTNAQVGIGTNTPLSMLEIQGSTGLKVTTITASTTLNETHNVVLCKSGPYMVTLPAAASNTGRVYYLKNIDADGDDFVIDANGSETIDGQSNYFLELYQQTVRLISDGANWQVLEESGASGNNTLITLNCDGSIFTWNDVTNPTTGEIWMDRNLGASQEATSSTDAAAYGDLYQWGRPADGHQCRNSTTTTTLSSSDMPGHSNFILATASPYDWRGPQNDSLWQGVNRVNNPCPSGYRLPTVIELDNERASWSSNNAAGAMASPLKLPMAGSRLRANGSLYLVGSRGRYWSSTVIGTDAQSLFFDSTDASMPGRNRAHGYSVRCIKD